MSALVRWDAFLAQIKGRHDQVRAEAEAAGRQFIASVAGGGDYLPMSHQLMAVNNRLQDLEQSIIATWHAKVDDAVMAEGNTQEARAGAYDKGQALQWSLDDEREELEIRLMAELARQRFAHAVAFNRAVTCRACGATSAPPISFRAIELACGCGARTPFEPGELMRSVAGVGTHALSQESVVREWRAMRAAERALHRVRPPRPLGVVQAVEASQITYWRSYLALRSRFEPEMGRDPDLEIRARMDQWYRSGAEFEEAWVAAGRPRAI